jgi:hypothetical protein
MGNIPTRLIAATALGVLAAAPIGARACSQYNPAAVQAPDPALAMIRQVEAQMNAPFADMDRLIAAQDAAMSAMFRQIDAITTQALRTPSAIQVAIPPGTNGQTSTVTISSVSNGQEMCSETVTYTVGPNGQPRVAVQRTGNACGNPAPGAAQTPVFSAPQPAPPQAPHTIQVLGPARPVQRYIRG